MDGELMMMVITIVFVFLTLASRELWDGLEEEDESDHGTLANPIPTIKYLEGEGEGAGAGG
jgi:hypothetical protein